jgi:4-hydroxy-tetrahydrodipicolinate synthase
MSAGTAAALALSAASRTGNAKPAKTSSSPRDGLWVAAITPVDRKYAFDGAVYKDMLALWKANGADGALVLGTTGEGQSFSLAERKRITEFALANSAGLDIIVATGTANFPDTIDLSKHAADAGANSVLIVPPFYEKNPDADNLLKYFDRVLAEVKSPVRYYHIPRSTGVPIKDVSFWGKLAQYPNVIGVKDSNGDATEYGAIVQQMPHAVILTGTDNLVELALSNGNGAILASANVFTRQIAAVWAAKRAGKDIAAPLASLKSAMSILRQPGYGQGMAATKCALAALMGTHQTFSRPPERDSLSDAEIGNIRAGVAQIRALG